MDNSVSVIIPCFNGEEFLAEAVESVLRQTVLPDEIIVVDDGSTDDTAAIAASYSQVTLLRQENRGLALARNAGIEVSSGDLIALLDADDLWFPPKLERQVGFLRDHAEFGFVFAHHRQFVTDPASIPRTAWPGLIQVTGRSTLPSTWMVRRPVFAKVGLFSGAMGTAEDLEWLMRASDAGFRPGTVEEVLVARRVHASNMSHDVDSLRAAMLTLLRDSIARKRGGSS